jgi:hypothetical protein
VELILRVSELAIVCACGWLGVKRYARPMVKIVPGDVLLWTLGLFFLAPLMMNVIGIEPAYRIYPGLRHGRNEPLVRALAAVGTGIAVLVALWTIERGERYEKRIRPASPSRAQRWWWLIASFLPLGVVMVSPDPGEYMTFAASFVLRQTGQAFADPESAVAQFSVLVAWSTYVSCITFAVWFSAGPRSRWAWPLAGIVGYMNLWLNGKRHIVAMFVIVLIFAVVSRTPVTRRQVKTGGAVVGLGLILILGVSTWYESAYRPHVAASGRQLESFVIDFSRQDVLRLALAGQLLNVARPLDYIGQSPVLHLQAVLPALSQTKPITYADRVTSVAYEQSLREQPGSITTSLMSEAVDNVGVAGLAVGSFLLGGIALLGSYRNDPVLRVIGAMTTATLTVVHVLAVMPIVIWMIWRLVWLFFSRRIQRPDRSSKVRMDPLSVLKAEGCDALRSGSSRESARPGMRTCSDG